LELNLIAKLVELDYEKVKVEDEQRASKI